MYTEVKSYQYVIALLKEYGIRNCVLSAGSRNVPFVHSVEQDPFFKCYSVVDERSAGYFAIGLSQELNEPVVISCTASTASCNYWPPVAEAFYQEVPLIILTSDRNPQMLGQWEEQMIDQVEMFSRHTKKSVSLPIINNKDDEIYCQRLLNEAFLELDHNGSKGPIHINIPTNSYNRTFNTSCLPQTKKIDRVEVSNDELWNQKIEQLRKAKRVLVICGQKNSVKEELNNGIKNFFNNYNSVIAVEHMSNIEFEKGINTVACMDSNFVDDDSARRLLPDIVITYGGQIFSPLKHQLKNNYGKFEHWAIVEDGHVIDAFKSLTTIFECRPEFFFDKANENCKSINEHEYYNEYLTFSKSISFDQIPYSHIYAIKKLVNCIPDNSILHLSINDSIRIANFFELNSNVKTYANIGTYGIDGCLSSFLGQANANPEKEAFLIIGDLAFFYDMNALRINSIPKNVHILMINNHGGSEFYYNRTWQDEKSDLHTSARHNTKAEGWVKSNGFRYLSANNEKSYDDRIKDFLNNDKEKPVFFEVFTEMSTDASSIQNILNHSRRKTIKTEVVRTTKEFVKKSFGQERAKKIINALKK